MNHTLKITLLLVALFFFSQIFGLAVVRQYMNIVRGTAVDPLTNQTVIVTNITFNALPFNMERPEVEESTSFVYIIIAILIGTLILLAMIRFKKVALWKAWYFLAVTLCLSIALAPFLSTLIAFVVSMIAAYYKVLNPKIAVHNMTELFVYGGLAAIFVPIMNMLSAIILLALLSGYDMIAVWKTKHMVNLAKFQTQNRVFAGLMVPYKRAKQGAIRAGATVVKTKINTAILGGGDIGLPLIFAGVVMKGLIMQNPALGFYKALIIPATAAIALLLLFLKSQKGKFYPAMPFLSIGCIAGWVLTLI